jgi:hypothetical protein
MLTAKFYDASIRAGWREPGTLEQTGILEQSGHWRTMTSSRAAQSYENLVLELRDEPGVTLDDDGLAVHGTVFAYLAGDDLVVDLSSARASDLVQRGMATRVTQGGIRSRDLVGVSDLSLWPELAREAHEYVGEPPVGGES